MGSLPLIFDQTVDSTVAIISNSRRPIPKSPNPFLGDPTLQLYYTNNVEGGSPQIVPFSRFARAFYGVDLLDLNSPVREANFRIPCPWGNELASLEPSGNIFSGEGFIVSPVELCNFDILDACICDDQIVAIRNFFLSLATQGLQLLTGSTMQTTTNNLAANSIPPVFVGNQINFPPNGNDPTSDSPIGLQYMNIANIQSLQTAPLGQNITPLSNSIIRRMLLSIFRNFTPNRYWTDGQNHIKDYGDNDIKSVSKMPICLAVLIYMLSNGLEDLFSRTEVRSNLLIATQDKYYYNLWSEDNTKSTSSTNVQNLALNAKYVNASGQSYTPSSWTPNSPYLITLLTKFGNDIVATGATVTIKTYMTTVNSLILKYGLLQNSTGASSILSARCFPETSTAANYVSEEIMPTFNVPSAPSGSSPSSSSLTIASAINSLLLDVANLTLVGAQTGQFITQFVGKFASQVRPLNPIKDIGSKWDSLVLQDQSNVSEACITPLYIMCRDKCIMDNLSMCSFNCNTKALTLCELLEKIRANNQDNFGTRFDLKICLQEWCPELQTDSKGMVSIQPLYICCNFAVVWDI